MAMVEVEPIQTHTTIVEAHTSESGAKSKVDCGNQAEVQCESLAPGELARTPNAELVRDSLTYLPGFYGPNECTQIEACIEDTVWRGGMGLFSGTSTVDSTPFRTKYFFGNGYTYGRGLRGKEELLPLGAVDAVPSWLYSLVIAPLEARGVIPYGWVDSVVMNDYHVGSSIVAHVDPVRLFARPIVTVSFFCPARLVFGASFDPERRTPPVYAQLLARGSVLLLDGYAANNVTHGIRPEDLLGTRRVSMILRRVLTEGQLPETTLRSSLCQASFRYPMLLASSWAVVAQIQGMWCDPSRSRFYFVQGLLVTVLISRGAASVQAAIWQLLPMEDGVTCNGGLLLRQGVSSHLLTWLLLQPTATAKNEERFLWMRVQP